MRNRNYFTSTSIESLPRMTCRCLVLRMSILLAGMLVAGAQPAMYVNGAICIHGGGELGLHISLWNDSPFEENAGLAGFYGEELLTISGAGSLVFHDMELLNPEGLKLEKPVSIRNCCNFILGDIQTPRLDSEIYLLFGKDAFYVGSSDTSKVDGTVAIMNSQRFLFPVGDGEHLRALAYYSEEPGEYVKCSYSAQNPRGFGISAGSVFMDLSEDLGGVGMLEYWQLEGEVPAWIRLPPEAVNGLSGDASSDRIVVAGWSKLVAQWLSLGQEADDPLADSDGFVSAVFVPNHYERIALGYQKGTRAVHRLGNYLLTPNGDGINDQLILPREFQDTENCLEIFDRNGIMVFRMTNYTDQFNGTMNTKKYAFHASLGLPEGIYYYVLSTKNPSSLYQGFIYLER